MNPAPRGWHMPAEWQPHEATWLAWPHNRHDWPGKFAPIPWVYTEIVRHLHTGELVHILVQASAVERRVRAHLVHAGIDIDQIRFFHVPTDRVWVRDYGPIFLSGPAQRVGMTDWHFNGWAKYKNWDRDDAVPAQLARELGLSAWQPMCREQRVVLEGGSIEVDGAGLLLTTEECLLSPVQERNPGLSRADLEQVFADYLGVRKVLWLRGGIAGDDTHGHVDDVTRFVAPGRVVTAVEANSADPNHAPLAENLRLLRAMTHAAGHALEVVSVPMPAPIIFRGQRLPASYANFYIGNEKVLVPTFNDPNDRIALGILADLFPGRTVIGIHAVDLIWGLGALHCLTQQQPAGREDLAG
jgi:agmatine deiminase